MAWHFLIWSPYSMRGSMTSLQNFQKLQNRAKSILHQQTPFFYRASLYSSCSTSYDSVLQVQHNPYPEFEVKYSHPFLLLQLHEEILHFPFGKELVEFFSFSLISERKFLIKYKPIILPSFIVFFIHALY